MNGVVTAVIVIAVFFTAGVVLGVTAIIALSVTGRRRRRDRTWFQYDDPPFQPGDPPRWPHRADPDAGDDPDNL